MEKEHQGNVKKCFYLVSLEKILELIFCGFLRTRSTEAGRIASNAHGMFE
jgi:hypothetical protein